MWEFFGRDVLRDGGPAPSLFMANYQTVGFVGEGLQVELRPKQATRVTGVDGSTPSTGHAQEALDEGIAFYQAAAQRFSSRRFEPPSPPKER